MTDKKRPMELGVLSSFTEDGSNPFDVIARYGVATTQLNNWDMSKWTRENAEKVKRDLKSSGVRLAALWTGYSGTVIWDLIDGPDTMGLIPEYTRKKRIADLKAGADFAATVKNLGGDAENPFAVFAESREVFAERREALKEWAAKQAAVEKSWRAEHKELARKLDDFLSGKLPEIDYKSIEMKADVATRAASATVLGVFAEKIDNMIVASADLSNSDKTDGYLKKTKAFTKGDFSGKFFQAGVSELTMACVANGMALHGGVIPVCGTFFVFSDYMKPAVRLSALMRLHVVYVWTHDSFRVGEDGPTHQPVEHEAQIRLMEHLRNHHDERSMLVLRPADGDETVMAWKLAVEEHRPVALVLSRQNIKTLPTLGAIRREEAAQVAKGGYVVMDAAKPAAVLIATGSEVATLVEGAELLAAEGIAVRVVNVPSEGLFRDQPKSYQESVLPAGVVRYGMTSGLPVNLLGLVGDSGTIHGLDHFGYSAPYTVLDEKFGYNGPTVAAEVKKMLGK